MPRKDQAPIAILSDFGYRDHYAGVMKGVIARIAPDAPIIDLTHGIPAQSIAAGAIALAQSWRYFPERTVFLAVVDPGVGTDRHPIAIATRAGARFVGPDNGLLAIAAAEAEIERMIRLDALRYRLPAVSSTFHGRDIFAPAAAWLWRGTPMERLGPRIRTIEPFAMPSAKLGARSISGEVVYVDGYGNLVTNIGRDTVAELETRFPGRSLWVRMKSGAALRILTAYGDAPRHVPLATFGSFELLEIAVRDASAAERFRAGPGAAVVVSIART